MKFFYQIKESPVSDFCCLSPRMASDHQTCALFPDSVMIFKTMEQDWTAKYTVVCWQACCQDETVVWSMVWTLSFKSGSGLISVPIWQVPVQLGYMQWSWIKPVKWYYLDEKSPKFIASTQILSKLVNSDWHNKGSTELYWLFIAADSIGDAITFIGRIVLWFKNKFSQNLAPAVAGFEFMNLPGFATTLILWYSHNL